jgi:hypothetical protein
MPENPWEKSVFNLPAGFFNINWVLSNPVYKIHDANPNLSLFL